MFVCLQIQFSVRARLSEYTRVRALTISFQGSTTRNSTASGPPYVPPSPPLPLRIIQHARRSPRIASQWQAAHPANARAFSGVRCTRTTRPTRGTMRLRARSTCSRSTGCRSACRCTRCVRARDVFFFFWFCHHFSQLFWFWSLEFVFGLGFGVSSRGRCVEAVVSGRAGRGGVGLLIGSGAEPRRLISRVTICFPPPPQLLIKFLWI